MIVDALAHITADACDWIALAAIVVEGLAMLALGYLVAWLGDPA